MEKYNIDDENVVDTRDTSILSNDSEFINYFSPNPWPVLKRPGKGDWVSWQLSYLLS